MAPKKMPKKPDLVDKLLKERELEYQGAMGIAVNDLRLKEAELDKIQKAYAESGQQVEGFEEFLANKRSEIRRAYRDIVSEQSYLFENDLRNYAIGSGKALDVTKTEAKQRQISQPIPGTQAHHPASVSSVESYLRDMPMAEQRRTLDLLTEQGYTVGSQAKGFIPLSGPAHLGYGERWGRDFAHVGKEGLESDPGRFKGKALPKTTTAEEAVAVMKPMLDEQIALNKAAYEHPVEQKMRAVAERLLGKKITWMGGEAADIAAQNKAAKAMGINATTISKGYARHPSLLTTEQVPGVNVMTDVGARVPLGMKASEEVRKQAAAVVRNPMVRAAKALSRAIPGPLDAALPAVVAGGAALASGATLPQAAQAAQSGAIEGLTGDLQGGDLANLQSYVVDGQQRFINQRNELVDQPGYGLQQRGGKWEVVKRGTGTASQQQHQAIRTTATKAANLIPQINRAINPVGAAVGDILLKPIGSAFNSVFGKREI